MFQLPTTSVELGPQPATMLCKSYRYGGQRCPLDGRRWPPHMAHQVSQEQEHPIPGIKRKSIVPWVGILASLQFHSWTPLHCSRLEQDPSIELNRVALRSALTCLRINCLLAHLPLHHLVRLASMKTYEVALSTKLRFVVETISHSTMSHDLGYVGLVLTCPRLFSHALAKVLAKSP
jgi:hypothetical protein